LNSLNYNADLQEIGYDSLQMIRLIIMIEEKFNIEVEDDDLLFDNFNSIEKIINIINKYIH